jgi:hypothetical protein
MLSGTATEPLAGFVLCAAEGATPEERGAWAGVGCDVAGVGSAAPGDAAFCGKAVGAGNAAGTVARGFVIGELAAVGADAPLADVPPGAIGADGTRGTSDVAAGGCAAGADGGTGLGEALAALSAAPVVAAGVLPVACPLDAGAGVAVGEALTEFPTASSFVAPLDESPDAPLESGASAECSVAALVAPVAAFVASALTVTTPDSGILLRLAKSSTPPPIKTAPPAIKAMRVALESAPFQANIISPFQYLILNQPQPT